MDESTNQPSENKEPTSTAPEQQDAIAASSSESGETARGQLDGIDPAIVPSPSPASTAGTGAQSAQPLASLSAPTAADQTLQKPPAVGGSFSLDEALKLGWDKTWQYWWPYIGITTATFLLAIFPTVMTTVIMYVNASATMIAIGVLASICGAVLQEVVVMGMLNLQLRVLDGQKIETKDVFSCFNRVIRFAAASILFKGMVFFGTLCFIFPGIYLNLKFQFYGYFIVERNLGPLQALRASAKITQSCKMDLFLFSVVQWFIGSAGMMMFLVGSFPAWLINSIATASVYRQLVRNAPDQEQLGIVQPPMIGESVPQLPLPPEIAESA